MSNLPEEIIAEILSRLPVKSLLRFRCVSNPWRNLISSPNFAKLHLKRTSEHNADIDHHTILTVSNSFQMMRTMNFNPSPPESYQFDDLKLDCPAMAASIYYIDILGSCNGLIFLRVNFKGLAVSDKDLVIWNPCTRDCKVLPKPGILLVHEFAFCGFGFDASIDDFKVVAAGGPPIEVEVFTLKTNTWRKGLGLHTGGDLGIDMEGRSYDEGTLVNGALHWIKDDCATILSFDLAQEQFLDFVSLPDCAATLAVLKICYTMRLGVLQGCLCFYNFPDVDGRNYEVWVMKEYGVNSSWSKLLSNIPSVTSNCRSSYIKPLCILKSGEVLLHVSRQKLVAYSPKDNSSKLICEKSEGLLRAVLFMESLVSLN